MDALEAGVIASESDGTVPPEDGGSTAPTSAGTWRRIIRNPSIVISGSFLALVIFVAIFGSALAPYDPNALDVTNKFASPSTEHWLGTDQLGRDLFSRLLVGTRVSIGVSLAVVTLALLVALPVGLLAGYKSGRLDYLLMRFVDAGLSIPGLVLALAIAGTMGRGVKSVIVALTVVAIPGFIRIVRGATLSAREEAFVESSKTIGTPMWWILTRRMVPNIRSPLLVYASFAVAGALLAEAGLSYLGFSQPPPAPTWGNMLRIAYDFALFTEPWQLVVSGLPIALTVLAFNGLGDGLRDVLGVATIHKSRRRERRGLTLVVREERRAEPSPTEATSDVLLDVRGLSVEFAVDKAAHRVVDDVSLSIGRGEVLGLVGESGSGKTVTSLAITRLLASPPGRIVDGEVWFDGVDLLSLSNSAMRKVRGAGIGMIFQDPMTGLDPAFTIGHQLVTAQRFNTQRSRTEARAAALDLLDRVKVPAAAQRMSSYPHELSGGMRQRVMIALALSGSPQLLIADEPTTALDVTIQAQILDLIRELQRDLGMAVLFVTHDLGVVADLCDRVAVMYAGQIVEQAEVHDLFSMPGHPYAEGLLRAMPQLGGRHERLASIPGQVPLPSAMPPGCRFQPRCSYAEERCASPVLLTPIADGHEARCARVGELTLRGALATAEESPAMASESRTPGAELLDLRDLKRHYALRSSGVLRRSAGAVQAVDRVTLSVPAGTTCGLVGESGSGKSTVARLLLALTPADDGAMRFDGHELTGRRSDRHVRRELQMVFQDPYSSFDPLDTIAGSLREALKAKRGMTRAQKDERIAELTNLVGLRPEHVQRYPKQLSGGQLQRFAIARALAVEPRLVVLDEAVSSLDVSTRAQIINLLEDLQAELGVAYLFIAHDLAVVRHVSDWIAVMYLGRIVEQGPADVVYDSPAHPYTLALLSAIPVPDPVRQRSRTRIVLGGDIPSPVDPPSGCRFRTRCPFAMPVCAEVDPPVYVTERGVQTACHLHTTGPELAGESVLTLVVPDPEPTVEAVHSEP